MIRGQTFAGCILLPVLAVVLLGLAVIRKMGWLRVTDKQFALIALVAAVFVICGGSYLFGFLLGY